MGPIAGLVYQKFVLAPNFGAKGPGRLRGLWAEPAVKSLDLVDVGRLAGPVKSLQVQAQFGGSALIHALIG